MTGKAHTAAPLSSTDAVADETSAQMLTPQFLDEETIVNARPAVPLSEIKKKRSWPTPLIIAALLFGLTVGVFGSMLLMRKRSVSRQAAQQPQTTNTETANAKTLEPTAANDSAEADENLQPEAETSRHQPVTASEDIAARQEMRESGEPETDVSPGGETAAALRGALNEWVAATNRRDIDKQMSFYNPTVNAFYLSRNASREDVRAEKARVFNRASSIDIRAAEPQIRVGPDGNTATMRFRKSYAIEGGGQDRRGAVLQELRWKRVGGQWKIVSERDVKVLDK